MSNHVHAKELVQSYQSGTFIMLNEGVMKEIGINPNVVLSTLLTKFNYHSSRNELDKDGMFFCEVDKMEELTTLGYKPQTTAIKFLESKGLIKVVKKLGNKRYFKIIIEAVKELIENFSKSTKEKTVQQEKKQEQTRDTHKEIQNCPKGKTELPKRENPIYKTGYIKPNIKQKDIKPIDNITYINSSSSISNITTREIPKQEDLPEFEKDDVEDYEWTLTNFLKQKGFKSMQIKLTCKEFLKKGITSFTRSQLQIAYKTMVSYHNNYKPVRQPHIFLANGMEQAGVDLTQPRRKKTSVEVDIAPPAPFYNWLEA